MSKLKMIGTILLCVILFQSDIFAQNTNEISHKEITILGHVIDSKSNEHISFANILVKNSTNGTISDENGHFIITLHQEGDYVLSASCLNYAINEISITTKFGETYEIDIILEKSDYQLNELTITGYGWFNHPNIMGQISYIKRDDLKALECGNSDLLEILKSQPGLRIEENCQNCGKKSLRINGLDGDYTQLMINSKPIFSSVAKVFGVEQFPLSMIESVEVLKGGNSTFSGGSAIAGAVNITTREPRKNSGTISHLFSAIGNSAYENLTNFDATIVSNDRNSGISIFGNNHFRQAYYHLEDGFTTIPKFESKSFGTNFFLRQNQYSKINVTYLFIDDFRRGGNKLDQQPQLANCDEQNANQIHFGILDYTFKKNKFNLNYFSMINHVDRDSYAGGYGDDDNPDENADLYFMNTKDFAITNGISASYNFSNLSKLIIGGDFTYNKLIDNALGYNIKEIQKINTQSFFIQDAIKFSKIFALLGVRFDNHNAIDNLIISPQFMLNYKPIEDLSLNISYSTGYKAPQIYSDDLHVSLSAGERYKIENNDDLKTEFSQSAYFSANYKKNIHKNLLNLKADLFITNLKNVFVEDDINKIDDNGYNILLRSNGNGANIYGSSLLFNYSYDNKISLNTSFTFQKSEYSDLENWSEDAEPTKKMFKSPNIYGNFDIDYQIFKQFNICFIGNYTGSMLIPHRTEIDVAVETPDFWDFTISGNFTFPLSKSVNAEISAGLKNIFNKFQEDLDSGLERDTEYFYGPMLPRTWFIGIILMF